MSGRIMRSGGPVDSVIGGAVLLLLASAMVSALVAWPVQCLAVGLAVAGLLMAAVGYSRYIDRQHEAAAAARREYTRGPVSSGADPLRDVVAARTAG